MADSGGWSRWLRNGRAATIALGLVFVSWLGFQIFKEVPPPLLDQILLYTVGVWFGNIAMETKRHDDDREADREVREVARDVREGARDTRIGRLEAGDRDE